MSVMQHKIIKKKTNKTVRNIVLDINAEETLLYYILSVPISVTSESSSTK